MLTEDKIAVFPASDGPTSNNESPFAFERLLDSATNTEQGSASHHK